jgi:hypothetical protein
MRNAAAAASSRLAIDATKPTAVSFGLDDDVSAGEAVGAGGGSVSEGGADSGGAGSGSAEAEGPGAAVVAGASADGAGAQLVTAHVNEVRRAPRRCMSIAYQISVEVGGATTRNVCYRCRHELHDARLGDGDAGGHDGV